MAGKKPIPKGSGKINPDDYLDYEDQYLERGGGSSGAKDAGRKGDKALRDLKKQQFTRSLDHRRSELESSITRVLDDFPDFESDQLRDQFIEKYVVWVIENLTGFKSLDPDKINIKFSKSGGPGGQNVNKRETKVRLVHEPTNIRVDVDQTRSQLQNKTLALDLLEEQLNEHLQDWKRYLKPGQQVDRNIIDYLMD